MIYIDVNLFFGTFTTILNYVGSDCNTILQNICNINFIVPFRTNNLCCF